MRIVHQHAGKRIERDSREPVAFFLRDQLSWFSLFSERQSRFEGWFLCDESTQPNRFYKLIERIEYCPEPGSPAKPTTLTYEDNTAVCHYEDGTTIRFILADGSLHVLANKRVPLRITLDMRGIYTTPEFGRTYSVAKTRDGCTIDYSDNDTDRPLYLSVRGGSFKLEEQTKRWHEQSYSRDEARHSPPYQMFTYCLGTVVTDSLVFGTALTREGAADASRLLVHAPSPQEFSQGDEETFALVHTQQALSFLHTPEGYYAGLPWFHQLWSRDELLTGLGLPREEQLTMIRRYLTFGIDNGELCTFAGSGTTCADGAGWFALLLREYNLASLNETDRTAALTFLTNIADGIRAHRLTPTGVVASGHNATWMDTIGRSGFRLEIQTMYALILEMIGRPEEQAEVLSAIRHLYYRDGYLIDGLTEDQQPDPLKRPNVFLAYLLQPHLLKKDEWRSCFDTILQGCRTTWGGLSSLDREASIFQPMSTGQDNRSYHNGDSWFFVNNLAALALHRLDSQYYQRDIEAILGASTEEILWKHFIGQPGEIASAYDGASWGCGIQGFSGGAYVKAIEEIRKRKD